MLYRIQTWVILCINLHFCFFCWHFRVRILHDKNLNFIPKQKLLFWTSKTLYIKLTLFRNYCYCCQWRRWWLCVDGYPAQVQRLRTSITTLLKHYLDTLILFWVFCLATQLKSCFERCYFFGTDDILVQFIPSINHPIRENLSPHFCSRSLLVNFLRMTP